MLGGCLKNILIFIRSKKKKIRKGKSKNKIYPFSNPFSNHL